MELGTFDTVLFDVDGTLLDTAPGITRAIRGMLRELGLPDRSPESLRRWIGPPLPENIEQHLGLVGDERDNAVGVFRRLYPSVGAPLTAVFPGAEDLLKAVRAAGFKTATATSKPEDVADQLLREHGLSDHLDQIVGADEAAGRMTKVDVISEALARLERSGHPAAHAVLIGDRAHDIEGGAGHDIPVIAAAWGYGSAAEFAGAAAVAGSPKDVLDLLGIGERH